MASFFMLYRRMTPQPEQYFLNDNGIVPNGKLPVLYYKKVLDLPSLFASAYIENLFQTHNWGNNWKQGIYTYHHYHSITYEVVAVCKGKTVLQLGGDNGIIINIGKEDEIGRA